MRFKETRQLSAEKLHFLGSAKGQTSLLVPKVLLKISILLIFWHAPTICRSQTLSGFGEKSRPSSTQFQRKLKNWARVGDFHFVKITFLDEKSSRMCDFRENLRFSRNRSSISPPEAGRASRRDLLKISFKIEIYSRSEAGPGESGGFWLRRSTLKWFQIAWVRLVFTNFDSTFVESKGIADPFTCDVSAS